MAKLDLESFTSRKAAARASLSAGTSATTLFASAARSSF
jgi:hypothetical protein